MSSLNVRLRRIYRCGLLAALAAVSCISADKNLVAKATASFTYHEAAYEWACVGTHGPVSCRPCYAALNSGRKRIQLANQVYKIGAMPKAEVAGLKELITALEQCP